MSHPNKIDKDAVHTALAVAGFSALLVGVINIGLEELKAHLSKRRLKDKPVVEGATGTKHE